MFCDRNGHNYFCFSTKNWLYVANFHKSKISNNLSERNHIKEKKIDFLKLLKSEIFRTLQGIVIILNMQDSRIIKKKTLREFSPFLNKIYIRLVFKFYGYLQALTVLISSNIRQQMSPSNKTAPVQDKFLFFLILQYFTRYNLCNSLKHNSFRSYRSKQLLFYSFRFYHICFYWSFYDDVSVFIFKLVNFYKFSVNITYKIT